MSTQINVTVGSGGLSDKARQLQAAARQAQLEKERTLDLSAEALDKRIAAQAAKGLSVDGSPLYGVSTALPFIERRPAANRSGPGLNLGHVWLFRDAYDIQTTTGIQEIAGASGRSRTSTRTLEQRQNVLIGSGDGSAWVTYSGENYGPGPSLPADTFSVSQQTNPPTEPISAYEISFYGTRLSGRGLTASILPYYFALPCGNGSFILVYGHHSVWDTFQSNAYYRARGLYQADGTFIGYFDFATSTYSSLTIPDDLVGAAVESGDPSGIVSLEGFRGKGSKLSVYVCNNKTIREISLPLAMQPFIDAAYPSPIEATRTISYRGISYTYDTYQLSYFINPINPYYDASQGYSNNYNGAVFTPQIFSQLNALYEIIPPSSLKPFSDKLKWGLSDNSQGAYTVFQDVDNYPAYPYLSNMYRSGLPLYHALWPNKNEEPDLSVWDPDYAAEWENKPKPKRIGKATLNLSPDRVSRPGAADRPSLPGAYWNEEFITVWDWDDPAYCRSMCKALGFTDADLTP